MEYTQFHALDFSHAFVAFVIVAFPVAQGDCVEVMDSPIIGFTGTSRMNASQGKSVTQCLLKRSTIVLKNLLLRVCRLIVRCIPVRETLAILALVPSNTAFSNETVIEHVESKLLDECLVRAIYEPQPKGSNLPQQPLFLAQACFRKSGVVEVFTFEPPHAHSLQFKWRVRLVAGQTNSIVDIDDGSGFAQCGLQFLYPTTMGPSGVLLFGKKCALAGEWRMGQAVSP